MESFAETEKKQKECEKLLQSAGFSMPDPGTGKEMGTHRAAKSRRPAGGVVVGDCPTGPGGVAVCVSMPRQGRGKGKKKEKKKRSCPGSNAILCHRCAAGRRPWPGRGIAAEVATAVAPRGLRRRHTGGRMCLGGLARAAASCLARGSYS